MMYGAVRKFLPIFEVQMNDVYVLVNSLRYYPVHYAYDAFGTAFVF